MRGSTNRNALRTGLEIVSVCKLAERDRVRVGGYRRGGSYHSRGPARLADPLDRYVADGAAASDMMRFILMRKFWSSKVSAVALIT